MTFTAATHSQALEIAAEFERLYAADGWEVEITGPLFDGDLYRVSVG